MKKYLILITVLIPITIFSQTDFKGKLTVPIADYVDSLQVSFGLNIFQKINGDSIVLTDKCEYFGTIKIYRNNKLIYEFKESDGLSPEIDIFNKGICLIFNDLYIFKVDNRPSINSYLIIKRDFDKFKLIGLTETSSAFIFADIDNDGKIEIGGFKFPFEGGIDANGQRLDLYQDRFRIYEISYKIKREPDLEYRLTKFILDYIDDPWTDKNSKPIYYYQPFIITDINKNKLGNLREFRQFGFISKYKLTDKYLKNFPVNRLRIMRNEIFAAHGYKFKSGDLNDYFSKQIWYKPCCTDVTKALTEIEKYNIQKIKEFEKK
ncbi:YARHG domain-containing protein [Saccharicrinis sp. FJH54]|uniref:YARHG domain-containing protein n=1 Tax=Saccharicrinis sp. FJH54 TaxID=3344665 RepID=UPI0035D4C0CE